jgi:hypothetical protein
MTRFCAHSKNEAFEMYAPRNLQKYSKESILTWTCHVFQAHVLLFSTINILIELKHHNIQQNTIVCKN